MNHLYKQNGTGNDYEFNITFEQLEGLIDYLNTHDKNIKKCINFDEYVEKHIKE